MDISSSTGGEAGVSGVLADPQLKLFNVANALINQNDNWGGSTALANAFVAVDDFAYAVHGKHAVRVAVEGEADVRAGLRVRPDQQAERAYVMQLVLHQSVARDGEVRRGHVEGLARRLGEEGLENVGHAVLLVVDDEGYVHGSAL